MTDHRLTPDPSRVNMSQAMQIGSAVADIRRSPGGRRDRQAVFGAEAEVLSQSDGWSYVQMAADGYCGFVASDALTAILTPTHRVTAPATHAYADADLKSPDQLALSFGSLVTVTAERNRFGETSVGHIPLQHLMPVSRFATDPGDVARLFLGTPYLWGGNSRWGIDCSGLIQAAFLACAIPCPGDSDQQRDSLADHLPDGTAPKRNDLLFWKGHVALVLEPNLMIHANAHAMAVTLEPIDDAIQRIAKTDGPVTAHKRLTSLELS